MKSIKEKVIAISKNIFFWIFLTLFLGPYLGSHFMSQIHHSEKILSFKDYILACYWFVFIPIENYFNIPQTVFNYSYNFFSTELIFVGLLGISQLLSLFIFIKKLAINETRIRTMTDFLLLLLFFISLPFALFVVLIILITS